MPVMDTPMASSRLRVALFVLVAALLVGLTAWLVVSGEEAPSSSGPPAGAQAPTAAPTPTPSSTPTSTPRPSPTGKPTPVPVTEARVRGYLNSYLTYTWLDDPDALAEGAVTAGGEEGTPGESPWASPGQWVACKQTQCSSELVSIGAITIAKGTVEANVTLRRSARGIPYSGPAVCHVSVSDRGGFTSVACVGGDG